MTNNKLTGERSVKAIASEFTKEQLITQGREVVGNIDFIMKAYPGAASDLVRMNRKLIEIALAALTAEPVYFVEIEGDQDIYAVPHPLNDTERDELQERRKADSASINDGVAVKGRNKHNQPVEGDIPACPFCASPVRWCGENEPDPEDNHTCHHIQCVNPECGADFNFIIHDDDSLPDDPDALDAMPVEEVMQPLRDECLKRFSRRPGKHEVLVARLLTDEEIVFNLLIILESSAERIRKISESYLRRIGSENDE